MWEKVAWECFERLGDKFKRDGPACKAKFDALAFKKCPTGTNEIPINIARAKKIKLSMDYEEVIGTSGLNNTVLGDMYNDDVYGTSNLCDEEGEVKRPATKKSKTMDVAKAIEELAKSQKDAAATLGEHIASLSPSKNGLNAESGNKLKVVEEGLVLLEKKFDEKINSVDTKLDAMLELLQGNILSK